MPFVRRFPEAQKIADIDSEGKFFEPVDLDNADVVADCRVEVAFDPHQRGDALVAVYSPDEKGDVGEPIDDLAFLVDRRPPRVDQPHGFNSVSFQVTGVDGFIVLVRSTGVPNTILPFATFEFALGTLTNREVA